MVNVLVMDDQVAENINIDQYLVSYMDRLTNGECNQRVEKAKPINFEEV